MVSGSWFVRIVMRCMPLASTGITEPGLVGRKDATLRDDGGRTTTRLKNVQPRRGREADLNRLTSTCKGQGVRVKV